MALAKEAEPDGGRLDVQSSGTTEIGIKIEATPRGGLGAEDQLLLGLTTHGLKTYLDSAVIDDDLLIPPCIRGALTPQTNADALALVRTLNAAGDPYEDPFKTPARRIMANDSIEWSRFAGMELIDVVRLLLNGYDFLQVRLSARCEFAPRPSSAVPRRPSSQPFTNYVYGRCSLRSLTTPPRHNLQVLRNTPGLETKSYCSLLAEQGNPDVGCATVFVSWSLASTLSKLHMVLERHLSKNPHLNASTTYWWICNFSISQLGGKEQDVDRAMFGGDVVRSIGSTMLYLEPWDVFEGLSGVGNALGRAFCVLEAS